MPGSMPFNGKSSSLDMDLGKNNVSPSSGIDLGKNNVSPLSGINPDIKQYAMSSILKTNTAY